MRRRDPLPYVLVGAVVGVVLAAATALSTFKKEKKRA